MKLKEPRFEGLANTMAAPSPLGHGTRLNPPVNYNLYMLDESQFRQHSEAALESLKQSLIRAEEDGEFEVEEQNGVLNIVFEQPVAKFVLTPNTPVRQIWISALSTSFKLEWSDAAGKFILAKTGEDLPTVVARVINTHLGTNTVSLSS